MDLTRLTPRWEVEYHGPDQVGKSLADQAPVRLGEMSDQLINPWVTWRRCKSR
jgi:hypothetical protein